MRVLGVDTSSYQASVAITENGRLIGEKIYRPRTLVASSITHSKNNHAETLLPLIESALATAALSLDDISGFAVAIGPGSFTGLRIGLSTVKGLAHGSVAPVTGVSTLHANAVRISNFNGVLCAILDARKKEAYAAIFRRNGCLVERVSNDRAMSQEKLQELIRHIDVPEPILLVGDGVLTYGEDLVQTFGGRVRKCHDEILPTVAAAVALVGEVQFARGAALSPASLVPLYLRSADAELVPPKLA
jgi:tRNA threonylcarbamoyladenosine biosynthesis protein TsaB